MGNIDIFFLSIVIFYQSGCEMLSKGFYSTLHRRNSEVSWTLIMADIGRTREHKTVSEKLVKVYVLFELVWDSL